MKVNKLWAAAALALALVSCKNEPAKEPVQQEMKFPVVLSLEGNKSGDMRATEKSNSLSASYQNERAIENLTVVVFINNNSSNTPVAVEKVITYDKLTKPTDPYQGEFKFDMGMAGNYQLEVIANGYKDDSDKDAFIQQFKQGLSYEQFKKIVYERALPNNGETGFAMLSTEPTKVTTSANETAHAGTIKLRRLACRFDVFNKLTDKLKLTKVTLQNQTDKSYLMTQATIPANAGNEPKEYTENGTWFTPTLVSAGIYSYENPVKGAVKLKLEGEYDGQAWEKTIELRDKNGNYVDTQRNHIYRVHLTKGNGTTPGGGDDPANADKINYVIEVLDWDEDASMDYEDNDVWDAELINPLQYVAEYNLNKTGDGFVSDLYDPSFNETGYFTHATVLQKYKNVVIDGKSYHTPSYEEAMMIVPSYSNYPSVNYDDESIYVMRKFIKDTVMVGGNRVVCNQFFQKNVVNGAVADGKVCYAYRFMDTPYQSVWKYERLVINGHSVTRITAQNVIEGFTFESMDNYMKPEFWEKHAATSVVRIFPSTGHKNEDTVYGAEEGRYWTTTPMGDASGKLYNVYEFTFDNTSASYAGYANVDNIPIRLFKDTLD